jgi:hypothetical protein
MNRFLKLLSNKEEKNDDQRVKIMNDPPLIIRMEPYEKLKISIVTNTNNNNNKSKLNNQSKLIKSNSEYDIDAIRKMVNNDIKLKKMSNELSRIFNKNNEKKLKNILI